ncbi:MAG: zinc-ribbon domain-containing protein, partial [Pseudomonadota bacterium]
MKLTCPNCAAQYEVPDEVIPETGRDVQCSACGDTWF